MASLLLPDDVTQPLQPLLPVGDDRPPALQPDDRADAMAQLYRQLADRTEKNVQHAIWSPDNAVGTETLQSMSMPKPTTYAGLLGRFVNPGSGQLTDQGRERLDNPALGLDTGGLGGAIKAAPKTRGLLAIADEAAPKLNPDAVGFADRISTRQPSLTPDVHDTADYTVGLQSFLTAPKEFQPRALEAIGRHIGLSDTSVEGFIKHLTGNIRAIYDKVPEEWRAGAFGWYNGARSIAEQLAEKNGTSVRAQAANIAAQSPQRQWDHNVEGSRRTADIVANHSDTPWSDLHESAWHGTPEGPNVPAVAGFKETNPDWTPFFDNIRGKTLAQVENTNEAALWLRIHDRAHAEHNNVPTVNPNGTFGDWLRKNPDKNAPPGTLGEPENLQWGNLGAIGNSISVLRDDSLRNISGSMGEAHKVRNFYNNIVSPDAGHDITADTHAISAALLRPLGSSHPEVSYGLGSPVKKEPYRTQENPWPTTMASAPAGLKGLYPLYAEAYRRVADNLGVLPRQVQSVTWEGIRGLYSDIDRKNGPLMRGNSEIWKAVSDGKITADEARAQILSREIRPPGWTGQ